MDDSKFVRGNRTCHAALASLVLAAALATPAAAADWANVVMYHRFGEPERSATNIRLEQFEAHLAELKNGPYTVLPLPEIVAALKTGQALPDRTVAITIDDAYRSVYNEAWPRLQGAGLPFTLFVATDPVDRGLPDFMTWPEIRELADAGVTIGSQTASHPHMPDLDDVRNAAEVNNANARILQMTGQAATLFAYPYGEYGTAVRKIVVDAGLAAAFGQQSGTAYGGGDMFGLPRFSMNENYGGLDRFRLAANALPLRVTDVTPVDTVLRALNPPTFGFTVTGDPPGLARLTCYGNNQSGPVRMERLGERRFEVRLDSAFPPGRGRINCTMPAPDSRWRWFGTQFYIPRP